MGKFFIAMLFALGTLCVDAQQSLYTGGAGIEINYTDASGVHYIHKVAPGHTLYALSRVFQVAPSRILAFNGKDVSAPIMLDEVLRIPFDAELLYTGASVAQFANGSFIPVYYTIKPKETLFRVSRVYFDQDAALILRRNGLVGSDLQVGQRLLMGWIPIDERISQRDDSLSQVAIEPPAPTIVSTEGDRPSNVTADRLPPAVMVKDSVFEDLDLPVSAAPVETFKEVQETGLAYWNKDSADKDNLFALHPTARINSLIEIYNPQLQRRTFAKVIARIPKDTYPSNIDVILSPRVAYTLGALNSEFRVRMTFFE